MKLVRWRVATVRFRTTNRETRLPPPGAAFVQQAFTRCGPDPVPSGGWHAVWCGEGVMRNSLQDLTYAVRGLRKRPGFLIAALTIVAVGIGANVTVFSIVNAMLFRPLPFGERSGRIVTLHATHRLQPEDWGWGDSELSYRDLLDLREARSLEALAGYLPRNFTLSGEDAAERVQGGSVTPNLFAVLGVEPMLGRAFTDDEAAPPGLETAVILTHGLWQRRYGGDPAIVGRAITVNERARIVVGVMPPNFRFPERDDIYLPFRADESPRSARSVNGVGVLAEGMTLAQVQSELDAIAARLADTYPATNRGFGVRVLPFRASQIGADERQLGATLLGAVGLVLVIACANLANLLLVRGAARQREVAVRAALGARRGRIVSGMLAESAVIALAGAVLGLLASQWVLDYLSQSFPEELPYWLRFDIDVRVALFTVALTVFSAIAVGLLPALRATRLDLAGDLKDASRSVSLGPNALRVQGVLAVAQVAICLALLVGANLMIRSFLALQRADLGFDERSIVSARAYLAGDAYDAPESRAAFFARAAEVLRGLPGATAAVATTSIPGDDGGSGVRLVVDGQASRDEDLVASSVGVTQGLFETLGVALVEGRDFTASETTDTAADVAIVNRRLAERLWPGESAVGRRIGFRSGDDVQWLRVVGVAPDVQYEEFGEETDTSRHNVYVSSARTAFRTMAFLVRSNAAPHSLVLPMRDELRRLHAGLPLYELMPMSERRRFTTWEQQFFGQMMGAFAAIALLLACVGIYALLAYAARRRTHEIGVRLALGAAPGDVVRLFVGQAGRIGLVGLVAGLVLAAGVSRAISGILFEIDAFDPWMFAAMAVTLLIVVLASGYLPARRAARVDPVVALRME